MKRFVVVFFSVLIALFSAAVSDVYAASLTGTGEIRGKVLCATGEPMVNGRVSIPARALVSTTDATGSFSFSNVPAGTYQLYIESSGIVLKVVDNVTVVKKRMTDVGIIEVNCITACTDNAQCLATEYCAKQAGNCLGQGVCNIIPELCPQIFDPVCGCDGSTYSNQCVAGTARVNVAYLGACKPSGACYVNSECLAGQYCAKAPGNCQSQGSCAAIPPPICLQVFDPVCGCDGATYSNECIANAAGVNIAYKGSCIPTPGVCYSNSECAVGDYCAKAVGDCEGKGSCTPKPGICAFFFDPVCGCNGITYSNECAAASAGVPVAHAGSCI